MMRTSPRKLLQGATGVVFLMFYTTLLIFWDHRDSSMPTPLRDQFKAAGEEEQPLGFQERAPRSLSESDYPVDEPGFDNRTSNITINRDSNTNTVAVNAFRKKIVNNVDLKDVFISIKTTKSFHQSRLIWIFKTWFVLAKEQTYFFTDGDDPDIQSKTGGHLVNTNCSSSHNRKSLCCKMSVEFDRFLESQKKWFCHFDDDNYVNVPRLVKLLQMYNPQEDWYLGKPSIRAPLEILSRENTQQKIAFWFATGGAGFCISKALALKMMPIASGGKFMSVCEKIRLPDDVSVGYIIEHVLRKKLTVVEHFHSHLETMKFIKSSSFSDQITFSYSKFGSEMNVLTIEGFDLKIDPTRFISLHCHLFPSFDFCPP
ncbi:fringe glycosyltransferase-like [Tachypleus tridentatus]|uniref:fringe glycosyltransferase-like n=1 Tax=Tachypleus tridentatus TaxID=6853 RepID=UPI003FD0C550